MKEKVDIKHATLESSPVIINSPDSIVKITHHSSKDQKGFFSKGWVKYIVTPLFILIIGSVMVFYITGGNKMPNPKVNIENSTLKDSPVIVDSPGTVIGNNVTVNPTVGLPKPRFELKYLSEGERQSSILNCIVSRHLS